MGAKKKAAGAVAAGKAAKSNPYVNRLMEDDDLRENLRTAFDSARRAYDRMNGKGARSLVDDKKVQKDLKKAAGSLKEASEALRDSRKGRKGRVLMLAIVGGAIALVASEGLRKKVLDSLFGAEEEFEYTSTTTPASENSASSESKSGSAKASTGDGAASSGGSSAVAGSSTGGTAGKSSTSGEKKASESEGKKNKS